MHDLQGVKVNYAYNLDDKITSAVIPKEEFDRIDDLLDDYYTYRVMNEGRRRPRSVHKLKLGYIKTRANGRTLGVVMSIKDYRIIERKLQEWDKITKNFQKKKQAS